ncbi:MAG TPA: methyltransferase domain-containing protein [Hanamia sp.]|nr:methyltransferase domain-containing protein [Hanamia sp.]
MIDYNNRSLKKEILDQNNIPFEDIVLNMKELEFINAHLGGHSITIKGFKKLLQNQKGISVCETGCGGGDNLNAINQYCLRNHIICSFTGIDINKNCIAFAKNNSKISNVNFIVSDYKEISFSNEKPDIIFSSLFCHHFKENELIEMLAWMKNNSEIGFFINDLHRHPFAYYFIKMATKIFSKSYLVKNDAPLSVLRGFKKNEWESIFEKAGIKNYSIKWKWAFRYLIVGFNQQNQ